MLKGFTVMPDRRSAIQKAVSIAQYGDVVLIAGKGHETYQILGTGTVPFDDRLVSREALDSIYRKEQRAAE